MFSYKYLCLHFVCIQLVRSLTEKSVICTQGSPLYSNMAINKNHCFPLLNIYT